MEKKILIKPAKSGLVIRDPQTFEKLPPEGKKLTVTTYWRRRKAEGSVIFGDAPSAKTSAVSTETEGGKK